MKYHIELDLVFKRNPYRGLYIALEGIDGSGKTVQVPRLREFLQKEEKGVVTTREPRKEGLIADIINRLLQGSINLPQEAFQHLFTVDRFLHHHELVVPALKVGKVVITDRCFWSAIPYGMWEMGARFDYDKKKMLPIAQQLLAMQCQFIVPDITFYLDVTPEVAINRVLKKADSKEIYEEKHILEKVIEGYQWLLQEFPHEFFIIDARKSIEDVTLDMIQMIKQHHKF
jgi:dTMP kinase